jgi:hypothetical protein
VVAVLPESALESVSLNLDPQKYYVDVIPTMFLLTVLYVFFLFLTYNMVNTIPQNSLHQFQGYFLFN